MLDADHHFRLIENAVLAGASKPRATWRTASWARCLQDYKLSPSAADFVCLTAREIKEEREVYGESLGLAENEIETTLGMIEGGGYSAHVANRNGTIIAERRSRDSTYYCDSDRVGAVWNEKIGGTNGIGTSLRDERATAVYLADHFYAELTGEACAAAPFFGPHGDLLGIVNLSTRNPGVPQLAHRVVFGVAQSAADRLETAYFRHHFRSAYALTVRADQGTPVILAIEADGRIAGATRAARKLFRLDDSALGARSLWALFEKLKGQPPIEQLCGSPRDLRLLDSGTAITAAFDRPIATKPSVFTPAVRKTTPAPSARRSVTLAECAGTDPQMQRNVAVLRKVAGSGLNLLLLGETGAGKDTLARALHLEGERRAAPFVAFNCAAVPEALIDSELFGYAAGAFTGAAKEGNAGRIVEADKGTLFLDEIGDMPLPLQTRFLRFLETQEVQPLGGGKARQVDVQIIAATHQDLEARAAEGRFRLDLYYRLAGAAVTLPPLRDRADLKAMIAHVLEIVAEGRPVTVSPTAWDALLRHSWPGNVRELRNVLTRASRLATNGVIEPADLMLGPARQHPSLAGDMSSRAAAGNAVRDAMRAAIERHGPDPDALCRALGVSRATLYRKLKQFGLRLNGA